jgi:hypothetical protein
MKDDRDKDARKQRECGNDLEIDKRLDSDAANLSKISHGSDALHDDAKDDRRDHHSNERDKGIS